MYLGTSKAHGDKWHRPQQPFHPRVAHAQATSRSFRVIHRVGALDFGYVVNHRNLPNLCSFTASYIHVWMHSYWFRWIWWLGRSISDPWEADFWFGVFFNYILKYIVKEHSKLLFAVCWSIFCDFQDSLGKWKWDGRSHATLGGSVSPPSRTRLLAYALKTGFLGILL